MIWRYFSQRKCRKHNNHFSIFLQANGDLGGGSIISVRHILAAAHCVSGPPENSYVVVGEHNIQDGVNEGGQRIAIERFHVHPDYYVESREWVNDIAILTLAEEIVLGPNVGLIEWRDDLLARYDGKVATVTGWGRIQQGGTSSPQLREVNITVLPPSNAGCQRSTRAGKFYRHY